MSDEPATKEKPPEDKTARKKEAGPGEVTLGDKITIYPGQPLPRFDTGEIKAFAAKVRGDDKEYIDCFALVCVPHLLPRMNAVSNYKSFESPALAPLVYQCVVFWPPAGQRRYVLLYQNTLGKRVLEPGSAAALGWKPDTVMRMVVKPVAEALYECHNRDMVHGGVRVSNMYLNDGEGKNQAVILGDCLSVPQTYAQSVAYETIPRAMAMPAGRGRATPADDIYAFGVALAVLMRTKNPQDGFEDEQIIKDKIERGSYSAIVGKDKFKGSILELLRGTLQDNPEERWTIEEIRDWIDGRRINPRQAVKVIRARRPLEFAGKKYSFPTFLAMDLPKSPEEAIRIVEDGELLQWLERAVENDRLIERVEKSIETTKDAGRGPRYADKLVTNLSSALDPYAPLRYRDLRILGEGFGPALLEAMLRKKELLQQFSEIFSGALAMNWLFVRESLNLDPSFLIGRFDSCRNYLRQKRTGYGLERCLYLLSPDAQCLSEEVRDYFVLSSEDFIRALEERCLKGNSPSLFLDRHGVAFLAARDPRVIEAYMTAIDSSEEHESIVGKLKCLAAIQRRYKMGNFPGIAGAFGSMLPVIYKRYHDRTTRAKIEKSIGRHIESGDLSKMVELLDDVNLLRNDEALFRQAVQEFKTLEEEANMLDEKLENAGSYGEDAGKQTAVMVSCGMAGVVILLIVFLSFAKHMPF